MNAQAGRNPVSRPAAPASEGALVGAVERLDSALRGLLTEHEELLRIAAVHRAAISSADVRTMSDCLNAQHAAAERIGELERQRQRAVLDLASASGGSVASGVAPSPSPVRTTMAQLTRTLAEPLRARLLAVSERLRDVLNRLQVEHNAIRAAAESLSSHMEGLMRQVCRRLSHAGTYARTGSVEASVSVVTTLDVRS